MAGGGSGVNRKPVVRLAGATGILLAVALLLATLTGWPLTRLPWGTRGETVQFHSWRLPDVAISAVVLGQVPDDQPRGGVRFVEVEDPIPNHLDSSDPAAFWTVWRADAATVDGMLIRALHFTSDVTTPRGTFYMKVESFALARTPTDPRDGLLAFLGFDPTRVGKPEEPLPDVFVAARNASLLTPQQLRILDDRQAAFEGRVADLLDAWGRLAGDPRDEEIRGAFLSKLARVHATPYLSPEEFFAADQRVTLRALGYPIRGKILHDYRGGEGVRYNIVIRDCPLSQLAEAWNGGTSALTRGMESVARPAIQVRQELRHHEVKLDVSIPMGDTPQARMETVLQALLALDGISLASSPRQ